MSTENNGRSDQTEKMERRMMSGSDIVVHSLIQNGVTTIFAYPGAVTMPLHQTMTRFRDQLRVILPRHEQGGGFAAQGYARSTGKLGVCMTTSGPGATNMVTAIADAKMDSVPMLIITGQVNTDTIGTDGFQETPMTEICRSITKHHCLVTRTEDIARLVNEAIFIATTGRPGPVLLDFPRNVLISQCYPDFCEAMKLPGYSGKAPWLDERQADEILDAIRIAKRPVLLLGGGVVIANASEQIRKFVQSTHLPTATTMPALSAFDRDLPESLGMVGMHGCVCANRAVRDSDLLIACGVRFSDRVTGKRSEFARGARVIHIDIDPSEINKVKKAHMGIVADLNQAFELLNRKWAGQTPKDLSDWYQILTDWKDKYPLAYNENSSWILPEYAISELSRLTRDKNVVITTGVGQHQMWTAQFYRFRRPRTWISSAGLGTMGFGLPAAMGVKVARPDALVIDIDGDGSLQMNIQEMATCHTEKIPVKVMLLNNQHLGMVMQFEDRFHASNRGNTYLGMIDDPEAFGQGNGVSPQTRYPDYPGIARCYGWQARSVTKKEELEDAMTEMIESEGSFLLEVNVPYREHVLPMMPPGGSVDNVILK